MSRFAGWKRFFRGSPPAARARRPSGQPIESYADAAARLDQISEIDPRVFVGDDSVPQEVCDFVLALAIVYCDLRDLWIARILVSKADPPQPKRVCPEWGDYGGVSIHVVRLTAGLLDELLDLIWRKRIVLETQAFQEILKITGESARESWEAIVAAAKNKTRNSLADRLSRIRNHAAYHYYNTDSLRDAYLQRFRDSAGDQAPFLSRGNSLVSSRFYFADAVLENLLLAPESREAFDALMRPSVILDKVREALYSVVLNFIDLRGGSRPWRPPETGR